MGEHKHLLFLKNIFQKLDIKALWQKKKSMKIIRDNAIVIKLNQMHAKDSIVCEQEHFCFLD